jgi:hypothetical protein
MSELTFHVVNSVVKVLLRSRLQGGRVGILKADDASVLFLNIRVRFIEELSDFLLCRGSLLSADSWVELQSKD